MTEDTSKIVLLLLKEREMSVDELVDELEFPRSFITGILKPLLNNGMITKIPHGEIMKFRSNDD